MLFEPSFFPYVGEVVMFEYAKGLAPLTLKLKLYLSVPRRYIEEENTSPISSNTSNN